MEKEYLTAKEVSKMLKVTRATVYTWTKNEVLTMYKVGKRVLYKYDDIKAFVEAGKQ